MMSSGVTGGAMIPEVNHKMMRTKRVVRLNVAGPVGERSK